MIKASYRALGGQIWATDGVIAIRLPDDRGAADDYALPPSTSASGWRLGPVARLPVLVRRVGPWARASMVRSEDDGADLWATLGGVEAWVDSVYRPIMESGEVEMMADGLLPMRVVLDGEPVALVMPLRRPGDGGAMADLHHHDWRTDCHGVVRAYRALTSIDAASLRADDLSDEEALKRPVIVVDRPGVEPTQHQVCVRVGRWV